MKKVLFVLMACIIFIVVMSGCKKNEAAQARADKSALASIAFLDTEFRQAADGLAHEPYGSGQLYGAKEAPIIWWDRSAAQPQEGEDVIITAALWREDCPDIYVAFSLNGSAPQLVAMKKKAILSDNGLQKAQYTANIGSFKQSDKIEYVICAGDEDNIKARLGFFRFTVSKWENINSITCVEVTDNSAAITLETNSLKSVLSFTLSGENSIKAVFSPFAAKAKSNTPIPDKINLGKYTMLLKAQPFSFAVVSKKGEVIFESEANAFSILTDGESVSKLRLDIKAPPQDEFYGFGMRYDSLNQRNKNVDIYCVNWYTDQNGESYTPIPFYFVPNKYGFYANSTYYSRFEINTEMKNICTVEIDCQNDDISFYLFGGDNAAILDAYTNAVGKPVLPPVWAFGPWISANEWNKQSEILQQLEESQKHEIPTSVIVIEAWSDEETFYTFNDSSFNAQDGSYVPKLSDFTFKGRWPNPKEMVDKIHEQDAKVLLWQIPVLKASASETEQSRADKAYAKDKGFVLKNKNDTAYQIPGGTWFGNSLLVDFTSAKASEWFLSKRKYLLEELKIDGFKTDGGEFVWGREVSSASGLKGNELRNLYPDLYSQRYFDYSRQFVQDALTFSRAGGAAMQNHPICWVGDQKSTPKAYEDAINASLSVSMSGVPFVAWDIAGFSGDVPTSELYQRAVAQAAFSPIMQIHSEASGDPQPSQARTPWNMAQRKGNSDCLDTYKYFANVRMNLLPYIYTQAMHSSLTGEPLMRAMAYEFPNDKTASSYHAQYMLGSDLLVAPVLDLSKGITQVYLPSGKWYGLFDKKEYEGGVHELIVPINEIPVFVREGAAIPVNLGNSISLGSYVGSSTSSYKNLALMAFSPEGASKFYDYVNGKYINARYSDNGRAWEIDGETVLYKEAVQVYKLN